MFRRRTSYFDSYFDSRYPRTAVLSLYQSLIVDGKCVTGVALLVPGTTSTHAGAPQYPLSRCLFMAVVYAGVTPSTFLPAHLAVFSKALVV